MSKLPEDLQTTLLQMLQRLESASAGFRREVDLVIIPIIPISLPQLKEKDDREKERLKTNQLEEAVVDKPAYPFSEAPVNMIRNDSQPRALSEIFRNHEVSKEAEDKDAKKPKERSIEHSQYGHMGREVKRNDRIKNPVKKDNPARLERKWYVVGKNGQPVKQMGASMIRRVQRQYKAYMNSLKTPAMSEASKNQKWEKTSSGGSSQFCWMSKKKVEKANSKTEGEGKPCTAKPKPWEI
ncbi:hypothetical protein ACFX2K_035322 [Malus domestica]